MKKRISDVTLLCDDHVQVEGDNYADNGTLEFLIEVTPPFNETVWKCVWKDNRRNNCSSIFSRILTQDGFCYTFNMLDKSDLLRGDPFPYLEAHGKKTLGWSLDGGYEENAPLYAYPHRAFTAGVKAGLSVHMKARDEDTDFYCRGPVRGFKILLHNPAEIPLVGERYLRSPLNQEVYEQLHT